MFVLEVYVRRDRKVGEKGEHADTQECCEGLGTVLTPREEECGSGPSWGLWLPPGLTHTKPREKRGLFWTQEDKGLTQIRKKASKKAPARHKILPLSWT